MCACMCVWWVGKKESFCVRRGKEKEKDNAKREERDRERREGGLDGERERSKTARETTSLARFFLERKFGRGRESVKENEGE